MEFETGGRAYYQLRLQSPTWPGGASGVTVGVGFDCGYNSKAEILEAWRNSDARFELAACAGITGERAKALVPRLRGIVIPWEQAQEVFERVTLPRFMRTTETVFPGVDQLPPDAQGALLSLVFNRGAGMQGDRRREMRVIRALVPHGDLAGIAAAIRAMKRLWVGRGLNGLLRRRDAEAALVEGCLQHADRGPTGGETTDGERRDE